MSQGVAGCCAVGAQSTGARPRAGSTCMSVSLITANFIKSACASCMQISKSVSVKENKEDGYFSVAIWIDVAAGKCRAPRSLGVAWEQGEVPSLGISQLGKGFSSQDAELTIFSYYLYLIINCI